MGVLVGSGVEVALHPEGVDRNTPMIGKEVEVYAVALHPEGVDRNDNYTVKLYNNRGRPPPGGRG